MYLGSVLDEMSFVAQVPSSVVTQHYLLGLLEAMTSDSPDNADNATVSCHAGVLERMVRGELRISTEARKIWGEMFTTFSLPYLASALKLPLYRTIVGDSYYRWTIDIFNQDNEDYQLPKWPDDKTYIRIVVGKNSFRPHNITWNSVTDAQLSKYESLNNKIILFHKSARSDFICGGMFASMSHFLWGPQYARHWPAGCSWIDFYWPWLVYTSGSRPKGLRDGSSEREITLPVDSEHPCRFLKSQPLEDGGVLYWSAELCIEDEEAYAKALGLRRLIGMPMRQTPMYSSW